VLRACAGHAALIAPVIILAASWRIVTPTEAAVLAVLYALVLGLVIYREIRRATSCRSDQHRLAHRHGDAAGGHRLVLSWIFAAQGIPG